MKRCLVIGLLALMTSCATKSSSFEWKPWLSTELFKLGHRNWVLIADSAYPYMSAPGIKTSYIGEDHLEAVRDALAMIDAAPNVRAVVHLDAELSEVPEMSAPGISSYRDALAKLLAGREIEQVPHGDLINELDAVGDKIGIVVLKTNMALPYTTVFIELDCGYWNDKAEAALRAAMDDKTP